MHRIIRLSLLFLVALVIFFGCGKGRNPVSAVSTLSQTDEQAVTAAAKPVVSGLRSSAPTITAGPVGATNDRTYGDNTRAVILIDANLNYPMSFPADSFVRIARAVSGAGRVFTKPERVDRNHFALLEVVDASGYLRKDTRGVGGIYIVQVLNGDGDVVGEWPNVPVRLGTSVLTIFPGSGEWIIRNIEKGQIVTSFSNSYTGWHGGIGTIENTNNGTISMRAEFDKPISGNLTFYIHIQNRDITFTTMTGVGTLAPDGLSATITLNNLSSERRTTLLSLGANNRDLKFWLFITRS